MCDEWQGSLDLNLATSNPNHFPHHTEPCPLGLSSVRHHKRGSNSITLSKGLSYRTLSRTLHGWIACREGEPVVRTRAMEWRQRTERHLLVVIEDWGHRVFW